MVAAKKKQKKGEKQTATQRKNDIASTLEAQRAFMRGEQPPQQYRSAFAISADGLGEADDAA